MPEMTFPLNQEPAIADHASPAEHGHGSHGPSSSTVVMAIAAVIFCWLALSLSGGLDFAAPHDDAHHGEKDKHADAGKKKPKTIPAYYAVAPFVLLLGAIAVLPLIPATEHWWESNLHRFYVAAGLAVITLLYYLLIFSAGGMGKVLYVLDHALLKEYIPFIVLLFSLYTISGGIRIEGDLAAHPATNTAFITIGGLLASFIGTTGAAMLLIRPLLETNRERKNVQHTVVFFIFVVCNCGGCLLPIGDPPLFLGYLKGVPFMWTMWNLWLPWLVINIILIAIYFAWDQFIAYPKETVRDIKRDETQIRPLRIRGLWPNALLLVGVVFAVALLDPTKVIPGTAFKAWPFMREAVQLGLVALSLMLGKEAIRADNKFNYHAILEVAALFIGIFICMQPALQILDVKGASLGLTQPWQYFWATGGLSAVLDNAPTYVVFFNTAAAPVGGAPAFASAANTPGEAANLLIGISLGAVFLGSMTYIGNGPNFMVKAIAEQSGVKMPSFFGYVIRYSLPILVPVFILATLLFLI